MGRDIVEPADAAEGMKLLELVGGRDHRVFPGKRTRATLGFTERTILRMVKNPYGDHRDWPAIREWAVSVARGTHRVTGRGKLTPPNGSAFAELAMSSPARGGPGLRRIGGSAFGGAG